MTVSHDTVKKLFDDLEDAREKVVATNADMERRQRGHPRFRSDDDNVRADRQAANRYGMALANWWGAFTRAVADAVVDEMGGDVR